MGRAGKNLFDVLFRLPELGTGAHVTRKRWFKYPGTHWAVETVTPYPRTPDRAKVVGTFRFGDWAPEAEPRALRSTLKREWTLLYDPQTSTVHLPKHLDAETRQRWLTTYVSKLPRGTTVVDR